MKVLFLTKYPQEGASSRYRVYQYIPYLQELGAQCDVSSFMDSRMYRLTFSSHHFIQKLFCFLGACWKRLTLLQGWHKYDIIYMQRELLPLGPPILERWLSSKGAKLIFDYDDAIFLSSPSKFNPWIDIWRDSGRIYAIFSCSRCVVAGNTYLKESAQDWCEDVRVLHVAEDTSRFDGLGSFDTPGELVIGWLGSHSTEAYLTLIAPVLERVLARCPGTRLRVVGGGDFSLESRPVEHVTWQLETEAAELCNFDIGIMPLPIDEWSLGKSGGKARTYMAAGVPVVATAIGYNCELIENGVNGFLVESEDQWEQALVMLLEDASLRREIGAAAKAHISKNFSVRKQAHKLFEILCDVADKPATRGER